MALQDVSALGRGIILAAVGSIWVAFQAYQAQASPLDVFEAVRRTIGITWRVKFFAPVTAFLASLLSFRKKAQRAAALSLSLLVAVLAYDSAVFWYIPYTDFATRFHSLMVGCIVAGLIVQRETQRSMKERLLIEREAALGRTARQVAHDIRSPLAALEMVSCQATALPEEHRLMVRGAVSRINDIANTLLVKNARKVPLVPGHEKRSREPTCLLAVLDIIVTEARMARRDRMNVAIQLSSSVDAFGLFTEVDSSELKRVVSNIVNNAVESISGKGEVLLQAIQSTTFADILVTDTGVGIPPDRMASLGEPGTTFGKTGGSGLGLHHAKTFLETCGGSLAIESQVGVGTQVRLSVPLSPAPVWFASSLALQEGQRVVILDDDASIHRLWEQRLAELAGSRLAIHHAFSAAELGNLVMATAIDVPTLYLVDYELVGEDATGLDCILRHGLSAVAVLVTSRAEEMPLQRSCTQHKIRLLPKSMASLVPIRQYRNLATADAVMIDDDAMIRRAWTMTAGHQGMHLVCFAGFDSFLREGDSLRKTLPIYVDFNLGQDKNGAEVTKKLSEMGFTNIYVVSGERPEDLPDMPWLSGISGKEFPLD